MAQKITLTDWLYFKKNALTLKIRALKKYYFFGRKDIIIGHNVFIRRGAGNHFFGSKNVVYDNAIFEVHGHKSVITTGNNCFFSYGTLVVCNSAITLGNDVWVGEYSSLRDATHQFSPMVPLGSMHDITMPITIGNNVWIGRGCIVLPGTNIGNNVIIAANSVVKGVVKSNVMFGGCPAKFIKDIDSVQVSAERLIHQNGPAS